MERRGRGPAPVVRHSNAADPDPAKVAAALQVWRQALAGKMALRRDGSGEGGATELPIPD